jgi:DNA (cytosine-5)-methyltransferase 1
MTTRALELFVGAGGLGMGLSMAGVKPLAVVEWDRWACDTLRENQRRGFPLVSDWPIHEMDARDFDLSGIPEDIEIVSGGPPCQPFSLGGKHRAHDDHRDMFPTMIGAIGRLKPKSFIVENVKGLTRASFANYFQYILLGLEFPAVSRKPSEEWGDHLRRLQKMKTGFARETVSYNVVATLVNAADHGVPQKRERVIFVGFRRDLDIEWNFPKPTHSIDALLHDQWVSGNYWERHRVARKARPDLPIAFARRVRVLGDSLIPPMERPWRTVRDAIATLPSADSDDHGIHNHRIQLGARAYPGHTGSPLDMPAKTLKAGDHGVPGGENMLVYPDGNMRYFTAREAARLQTFPDGFVFHGSWSETMRQLGNAVPVVLGAVVARGVLDRLLSRTKIVEAASKNQREAAA